MSSVLIVDDEPNIRRMVGALLASEGYEVRDAADGSSGLARAAESTPDVVLLDLMMPNLSGLDVLARIRASDRLKHLPCIILTAAGQETQHQKAMELGATEFLTKPFSPKKLYARTAELAGLSTDENGAQGS